MTFEISELTVWGVFDAGMPNLERIVIQANEIVDLANYGLMLGVRGQGGSALPVRDNLLWFGHARLNPGDWVFVYTAAGDARVHEVPNNSELMYSLHWGKKVTIFNSPELVPMLFRMDGVQMPTQSRTNSESQQLGADNAYNGLTHGS